MEDYTYIRDLTFKSLKQFPIGELYSIIKVCRKKRKQAEKMKDIDTIKETTNILSNILLILSAKEVESINERICNL